MQEQFQEIKDYLEKSGFAHKFHDHAPIYTSEEASRERGVPQKQGAKSIIFKTEARFVLVIIRGDRKADWDKLRKSMNCKKIRLANPDEVLEISSCEVGSIHPFGLLFPTPLPTYMDRTILENDEASFSVALHTKSCTMKAEDLQKATKAEIVDI